MPDTVFLRITSAVAIDGAIHAAEAVVEVAEDLAINLLNRGKAVLATVEAALDELAEPDADAMTVPAEPAPPETPAKPEKPAK